MLCQLLPLPSFSGSSIKGGRLGACLYGYQGADNDAEQLALTEQLFDAALGERSVVASGQPCLLVGDFNVEPTKIHCLAKGISAGLWVDLEVSSAWEDPLVHPYRWLRPDLIPPAPFLQCQLHFTPDGPGFFQIQPGLMRNSERLGFPTFVVVGKVRPALRNSTRKIPFSSASLT